MIPSLATRPLPRQTVRAFRYGLLWCALLIASAQAAGPAMTPGEQAQAAEWAAAKFEGVVAKETTPVGLVVLANNDPVQLNARAGRPMKIGHQQYTRGLYCHAVSKVVVRLPEPGRSFSAIIGVDSNEQTSGGRGSVVFAVKVNGEEAFRSGLMREGMAGVPVNVPLDGASEFVLEVGEGGDGISCDQSDWADAKVVLGSASRASRIRRSRPSPSNTAVAPHPNSSAGGHSTVPPGSSTLSANNTR